MITTIEKTVRVQTDGQVIVQAPASWRNDEIRVVLTNPRIADRRTDALAAPLPPDTESWQERFKRLGIGPDDWRASAGAWKGKVAFSSETLFAERRREVENEDKV
jgi:hypothetical protein